MIYLQLLLSFMQIGLFSIGGGYAAMPLIQSQTVELHSWLTMSEFTDLITIAEMTPGPIAVNSATFVGMRIAGPLGAAVATLGCILPSCVIVSVLAWIYLRYRRTNALQCVLSGVRPAVVALIASAGVTILLLVASNSGFGAVGSVNIFGLALFAAAFTVLRTTKANPVFVMLGCGAVSLAVNTVAGLIS